MDVLKIVRYVFALVGAVLIIGAVLAVQSTRSFLTDSVSTRGTVQELVARSSTTSDRRTTTITYAPVVQFSTPQGETVTFVSSTASDPPDYQVGETVEVLYSRTDPHRARIHDWFSLWGPTTILAGLGSVFFAIGAGLTLAAFRGRRGHRRADRPGPARPKVARVEVAKPEAARPEAAKSEVPRPEVELRSHGVLVQADIQRVEPTHTYCDNGSENHRIIAQWLDPDRHEIQIFTSEDIPFDPAAYLAGKKIDVYIAPGDPGHYYMDVSFLPTLAP
jgi:hypothetical protein